MEPIFGSSFAPTEIEQPKNAAPPSTSLVNAPTLYRASTSLIQRAVDIVLACYFEKCEKEHFFEGADKNIVWSVLHLSLPKCFMTNIPVVGKYIKRIIQGWWSSVDLSDLKNPHIKQHRKKIVDVWAKGNNLYKWCGIRIRQLPIFDINSGIQFRTITGIELVQLSAEEIQNGVEEAKNAAKKTFLNRMPNKRKMVRIGTEGGPMEDSKPQDMDGKTIAKRRKTSKLGGTVFPSYGHPPMFSYTISPEGIDVSFADLCGNCADTTLVLGVDGVSAYIQGRYIVFHNSDWEIKICSENNRSFGQTPTVRCLQSEQSKRTIIHIPYRDTKSYQIIDNALVFSPNIDSSQSVDKAQNRVPVSQLPVPQIPPHLAAESKALPKKKD